MDFGFDDEQLAFRDQLRTWAERECGPEALRQAWATPAATAAWSASRWGALADMGVVGLTVPEAFGGLGLGFVDLVLLLEEAGRALLPEPLLETTGLAVPLLSDAPGAAADALRAEALPKVAAGELVCSVGRAATAVEAALGADLLLLEHRGALHALTAAEVTVTPVAVLDGARRPAIVRPAAPAGRDTELVPAEAAGPLLDRLDQRAAVGAAASLVGVADRLVGTAAAYAVDRHQFGRPVGSFQAVKHLLADAATGLEFARPAVYRAAWSVDEAEPTARRDASMAKALASEAALAASRVALQVHGAIGYTWEHDLHLAMKRAWALARAWGDASSHRAVVLQALLAGAR